MQEDEVEAQAPREPIFKAPWPAVLVSASIVLLYLAQTLASPETQESVLSRYALVPSVARETGYLSLLTYMLLHGSWAHALINAAAALAFGPPVARLLGAGARGVCGFLLFYVVCGLLSALGYLALNVGSDAPVVGASGAISGLFGAASRLLNREGRLAPLISSGVFTFAAVFVVLNVVLGGTNLTPGAGGMPVAWQAHIGGFMAGVMLIGPWMRLFGGGQRAPVRDLESEDVSRGPWGPSPGRD